MSELGSVARGPASIIPTGSVSRQSLDTHSMAHKASEALGSAPSTPETPRTGSIPCKFPRNSTPPPAPAYRPTPAQRRLLSALAQWRWPHPMPARVVAACEARGWLRREACLSHPVLTDTGRAALGSPVRGDWVDTIRSPHGHGIVLRVSRDGAWADVRWRDGGNTWVKRMPLDSLRVVVTVPFAAGTVTDVTRKAELAAAGGGARG